MSAVFQEDWKYLGGALGIHLMVAVLLIGFNLRSPQAIVPQLAIKGVVVSESALNAMVSKAEPPAAPVEQQEMQQENQVLKQKENQARVEEQKRLAVETEKKQQILREKQAAEVELKKQKQEAEKKRLAEIEQKKRDTELKRQAELEAKAQKEREVELRAQMAEEEGRASAVNAGLLNQYVALIQQKVIRNWIKPPTAKSGLECEVKVTQAAGGTVLSVSIGRCNGDQAVRTSIETAVQAASPLPAPPDARLFQRNLLFIFKPSE
jgi:colicin import membrane protein